MVPAKTRPPAVARAALARGASSRRDQRTCRESRLTACINPYLPAVAGSGRFCQRSPVRESMQVSVIGMKSVRLWASYAVAIQFLAPSMSGQMPGMARRR
jgi:hypothetical protein